MAQYNTEELKAQLGNLIWRTATNLVHGGKVSPVQFMDYMLGTLFYRFVSENIQDYMQPQTDRYYPGMRYADMPDEKAAKAASSMIKARGFAILPSQLFERVAQNPAADPDLNTTLSRIFNQIEQSAIGTASEQDLKGLFSNFDTNNVGLGSNHTERNQSLQHLLECVRDLDFAPYREAGLDVFGLCYEHLIKMYALNSGTKGGEFYTPGEVSYLLARIAADGRREMNKVYDPACGSGSLLLNFRRVLEEPDSEGRRGALKDGYYGQEINVKTYNLCRMNMFLHNVNYDHFDIQQGDTLLAPKHSGLEPFDAIVSNPPYSSPWDGADNVNLVGDPRFSPAGILAPKSKADLAFVMHILAWLSPAGTAAIVEFPGVLYRGGAEQKIRKYLVDNNFVDALIQLPPNLFFGTSISTCIIVLKKNKKDSRITFVDAQQLYVHEGNKNKLSEQDIERIYQAQQSREEVAHFCHVATHEEVAQHDYNLSVSTYVAPADEREEVDIRELNAKIGQIVARQAALRTELDQIIAELEK